MGLFKNYVSQTRKPEGVLGKIMLGGYRDIYQNVGALHKLMIHFCDRLVKMKIVKIHFSALAP